MLLQPRRRRPRGSRSRQRLKPKPLVSPQKPKPRPSESRRRRTPTSLTSSPGKWNSGEWTSHGSRRLDPGPSSCPQKVSAHKWEALWLQGWQLPWAQTLGGRCEMRYNSFFDTQIPSNYSPEYVSLFYFLYAIHIIVPLAHLSLRHQRGRALVTLAV